MMIGEDEFCIDGGGLGAIDWPPGIGWPPGIDGGGLGAIDWPPGIDAGGFGI